jgi:uncharacterized protein
LIDLEKASTVMKAQIVSTGKLFYEQEPLERKLFAMRPLKGYALLNEECRMTLENSRH